MAVTRPDWQGAVFVLGIVVVTILLIWLIGTVLAAPGDGTYPLPQGT